MARRSQAGRSERPVTGMKSSREARKSLSISAAIALGGTAYFVIMIAVLHFLRPDISPLHRPTSEYAVGPFGYLMTSAFVAMSLATSALVLGLGRDLPRSGIHRVGLVFLGLWAVGLLVAATFPIDAEGAPQTLPGTIHRINGPLTFLSLIVGTNLVSQGFKQDRKRLPIQRFASALALLMIPMFVAVVVAVVQGSGVGLAQRVLIATLATWFFLVAVRLWSNRSVAGGR